eukprot:scaffold168360_cov22-Tisochrysis_lutea.AAC.1
MMLMRYVNVHFVLDKLVIDKEYTEWLAKQKTEMKEKGAETKRIVRDDNHLKVAKLAITLLEPVYVYRLLRLTDGKLGANLAKIYGYLLQIDEHFREPINGLDDRVRQKMHVLFMARWEYLYLHSPVMTAAYCLEPEFCRRQLSSDEMKETKAVLKQMATEEH